MSERGRLPGQGRRGPAKGRAPQALFVLREQPCPYLPGRLERKVITSLDVPDAALLHGQLARAGFRRTHGFAYRPACPGCNACVPVRVPAAAYAPSKSLRRVARRNTDLQVTCHPPRATGEQYALFARYIAARHGDGEMRHMAEADFAQMIEDTPVPGGVAEWRTPEGRLCAALLYDELDDGASAVYSFFDPDAAARSLGCFMVHWLIGRAAARGWPYVYLGYWIAASRKMAYKARFRPLEALSGGQWRRMPPPTEDGSNRNVNPPALASRDTAP